MSKRPRVLLIGAGGDRDRPDHFGCGFVAEVLRREFQPDRCLPVAVTPAAHDLVDYDFVIVNAEGSTHHNANKHLYRDFKRPTVMINGVWEANDPVDLSHLLYCSVRESMSQAELLACNIEAEVVPDVMLYNDYDDGHGGGLVVSDSVVSKHTGLSLRRSNLARFLNADWLVCGRFHAACLAIATGKPFACYPSNTHKTAGMMYDAGLFKNYWLTMEDAKKHVPPEPDNRARAYLLNARMRIRHMIETVNELIAQCAS